MPFTANQGAKLYWDEQGQGEPVLMINGLTYPSYMWHRTRPALNARFRTVAFDNRGIGQSEVPPGPYPISLMASDAAAVLDAAGIESAHVLGYSIELFCELPEGHIQLVAASSDEWSDAIHDCQLQRTDRRSLACSLDSLQPSRRPRSDDDTYTAMYKRASRIQGVVCSVIRNQLIKLPWLVRIKNKEIAVLRAGLDWLNPRFIPMTPHSRQPNS